MTQPLSIAIATCREHPGFCAGDDEALIAGLTPLGIAATPAVWNDPAVDWAGFDAVLIRTTWDYTSQVEAFIRWIRETELVTPVFKGAALASTNLHKSYLKRYGDAAVPTAWLGRGGSHDPAALARQHGWERVALKPSVGAGAEDLLITGADDADRLRAHAAHITARCDAMLQPLVDSIQTAGELSVVLIDGVITHAVRKVPAAGEHRVQIEFGGDYTLEVPPPAACERCELALQDLPEVPLYARVDLVEPEPGLFWIIEVELVEPELFFPLAPDAAAALGTALRSRLASTMPA